MNADSNRQSTGELAAGDLVGDRFRIESTVGVGGMATVYRALDESLGRTVALKVFRTELADADDVRRQKDEVQLLASLNAPALVTLFDAIAEGGVGDHGRAFLVLEFVDGVDLRTRLLDGLPNRALVARIGSDVAGALSYIHSRGVVHRDVKPGNILLPHDHSTPGAPIGKLADFGIARLIDDARMTATGTVIGTATYLSPEQAQGTTVGTATDVYSLGLVLLEALTGQRAFPGTAIESALARLTRDPEIPTALGESWRQLLAQMTVRKAEDRPDAAFVAAALIETAYSEAPGIDAVGIDAVGIDAAGIDAVATATVPLAMTEQLEPTKLLRQPDELAATMVLAPSEELAPTMLLSPGTEHASPARRRKRPALVGAASVGLLAVLVVGVLAVTLSGTGSTDPAASSSPSPKPSISTVAYPAVPGTLGEHLRQLQQSVKP